MKTQKKIWLKAMSFFFPVCLAIWPALHVFAESGDGFRLEESGAVILDSEHAAKEGISSLQFALTVEAAENAKVEFVFAGSNASVCEYCYDAQNQTLNIYIAGKTPLFAENSESLSLGRVLVTDGNGSASALVGVAENSLKYVYGSELKTMEGVNLPENVMLESNSSGPLETPRPTQQPVPDSSQGNDIPQDNTLSTQTPVPGQPPENVSTGTSIPVTPYYPDRADPEEETKNPADATPAEGAATTEPEWKEPDSDTDKFLGEEPPEDVPELSLTSETDQAEKIAVIVMAAVGIEFVFTVVIIKKLPGNRKRKRRSKKRRGRRGVNF